MKLFTLIQIAVLTAFITLPTFLSAKEDSGKKEKVSLGDCPPAVQATLKAQTGSGKLVEIEKVEESNGAVVFEAEIKRADGTEVDVKIAENGKVLEVETSSESEKK